MVRYYGISFEDLMQIKVKHVFQGWKELGSISAWEQLSLLPIATFIMAEKKGRKQIMHDLDYQLYTPEQRAKIESLRNRMGRSGFRLR